MAEILMSIASSDRRSSYQPARLATRSNFNVVVYFMTELLKNKRSGQDKYRLQAFWEYLEGYSMAFDLYPDCGRNAPPPRDVYKVVQDYWQMTDDLACSVKRSDRANFGDGKPATTHGTQERPAERAVQGATRRRSAA